MDASRTHPEEAMSYLLKSSGEPTLQKPTHSEDEQAKVRQSTVVYKALLSVYTADNSTLYFGTYMEKGASMRCVQMQ